MERIRERVPDNSRSDGSELEIAFTLSYEFPHYRHFVRDRERRFVVRLMISD